VKLGPIGPFARDALRRVLARTPNSEPRTPNSHLPVLAGELRKLVRFLVQIVGEPSLFVRAEFTAEFFTFGLEFPGALDHGLILGHIALLHSVISHFEVAYVRVITLQIFVSRLAAERWATL
jgi:hypothetical protein